MQRGFRHGRHRGLGVAAAPSYTTPPTSPGIQPQHSYGKLHIHTYIHKGLLKHQATPPHTQTHCIRPRREQKCAVRARSPTLAPPPPPPHCKPWASMHHSEASLPSMHQAAQQLDPAVSTRSPQSRLKDVYTTAEQTTTTKKQQWSPCALWQLCCSTAMNAAVNGTGRTERSGDDSQHRAHTAGRVHPSFTSRQAAQSPQNGKKGA